MAPPTDFGIESSIPVLRLFDESKSRTFYLDLLGYSIDWEHSFSPSKPDSRYTGVNTDLNLQAPSGKLLTFWLADRQD